MTKYARKKDGCWIDVYTVPGDFPDLATLTRCLPGEPFSEVSDDVRHGDFVDGDGFIPRSVPEAVSAEPQRPAIDVVLERLSGLEQALGSLEAKIDAIAPAG